MAWLSIASLAGAQGPTDLSEVLAQPLDAAFRDAGSAGFLSGGFDAHRYALWLAPNSVAVQSIEDTLRYEGFVRGYSRTWSEPVHAEVGVGESRLQYLTETIEEFSSGDGAQLRQDGTRAYSTSHAFEKAIEPSIPGAWGAVVDAGYSIEYQVSFRKGNDVYFVMMDSAVNDMTDMVMKQATSQFDKAPPHTIQPDRWQTPAADAGVTTTQDPYAWTRSPITYAAELLSLIVIGRALVFIFNRRRPT